MRNRKTSSATWRRRRPPHLAQPLEPRRLLSFTVDGTDSADLIVMFDSGGDEHIIVNGVEQVTSDGVINVNAKGGNDTIKILSTSTSLIDPDDYTIDCGTGHDTVTAGNGNFGEDIGAAVAVTGDLSQDRI